jgi:hypothetical protein
MMVPALTWDPWCTSAHAPEDLEDERAKVSDFHSELTQLYLTVNLHIIPQSPADDQVFLHKQGFFQGFFKTVKRPQKLNLELSFETQSSRQSFSAVKMKLFELNS